MKISKQALIAIYVACGFKAAGKWSAQRLQGKVKELVASIETGFETEDEKMQTRVDKLVAAVNAGKDIEVTEGSSKEEKPAKEEVAEEKPAKTNKKKDKKKSSKKAKAEEESDAEEQEEQEEEEEEKPAKTNKKKVVSKGSSKKTETKPAKKSTKKAAAAKKGEGRDRFGNRIGTGASVINSALGKKAKTVADIAAETKEQPQRVRAHLKWLEEREFVQDTDKGWKVTGTTA